MYLSLLYGLLLFYESLFRLYSGTEELFASRVNCLIRIN